MHRKNRHKHLFMPPGQYSRMPLMAESHIAREGCRGGSYARTKRSREPSSMPHSPSKSTRVTMDIYESFFEQRCDGFLRPPPPYGSKVITTDECPIMACALLVDHGVLCGAKRPSVKPRLSGNGFKHRPSGGHFSADSRPFTQLTNTGAGE